MTRAAALPFSIDFGAGGTPGSLTDCGRVFILLGPPDDVKKGIPAPEPGDEAAIVAAVERTLPWLVLAVGLGGLLVILVMMMFKPF